LYRLFGSPTPLRRFDAPGDFQALASRTLFDGVVRPLTDFGPCTETPPGRCLGFPAANRRFSLAPPLRFLPLQRSSSGESACCPVPTRAPSLFDLSQVLEGFLLTGSCGLISYRCRSWGSHPSELLSYRRTLLDSSSSDPLSTFLRFSEEIRLRPQGFL